MPAFSFLKTWRALGDFIFPLSCAGCGRQGAFACAECLNQAPLLSRMERGTGDLEALHAAYPYAFPLIKGIIKSYKYYWCHEAEASVEALARRWSQSFAAARLPEDAVVVPVPLHPLRLKERGFNQAEAVARGLAAPTGLSVMPELLRRVRYAAPQARTDDRERIEGLGLFSASSKARGRTIIIADDVWTTGATMGECAAALREVGAARVIGFALADAHSQRKQTERKQRVLEAESRWWKLRKIIRDWLLLRD